MSAPMADDLVSKVNEFMADLPDGPTRYYLTSMKCEIEQLRARIAEMRKTHSEDIRDLQREMRDAVAEERWSAQQGQDYGSY